MSKPGRDPRDQFESVQFAEGVKEIADVKPGMRLPGVVTNITAFGVFVDIGVHQDGLIHISELSNRFVKNANEVVKVHQKVMVTVLDVDLQRKRISLSLREGKERREEKDRKDRKDGQKESDVKTKAKEADRKRQVKSQKKPERFSNNPFAVLKEKMN